MPDGPGRDGRDDDDRRARLSVGPATGRAGSGEAGQQPVGAVDDGADLFVVDDGDDRHADVGGQIGRRRGDAGPVGERGGGVRPDVADGHRRTGAEQRPGQATTDLAEADDADRRDRRRPVRRWSVRVVRRAAPHARPVPPRIGQLSRL